LVFYVLFLITGAALILIYPKGEVLLWINRNHNYWFDQFFKWVTLLGDGILYGMLAVIFLFIRYYFVIYLALVALVQTLLVHFFKQILFADMVRPSLFFEGKNTLQLVEGVRVHGYHSFPSGHTATAFAIAFTLIFLFKKQSWNYLLVSTAILVGISRVYLVQHFFIDIYFGSIIGFTSVLAVQAWSHTIQGKKLADKTWSRKNLVKGKIPSVE
jgi:membrane-associated phospholipid phosphatase